jgi:hypothetical protein
VSTVTNKAYTELASGLCYEKDGRLVDAVEEITITNGGASATQAQHKVHFAGNANTAGGAVRMRSRDGKTFATRVYGLSYWDPVSGTNILLAPLQDCQGTVVGNRVVYTNAFQGLNADLEYVFTKSGLEQNVILRAQLPTPESIGTGLASASTRLEVLTEFFSPPVPNKTNTQVINNIADNTLLDFGAMRIGMGKAFFVPGQDGKKPMDLGRVSKHWRKLAGRDFLFEEVPYRAISNAVRNLPVHASAAGVGAAIHHLAALEPLLPTDFASNAMPMTMQLAKAMPDRPGVVLDYMEFNAYDNVDSPVFQSDRTYYINGNLFVSDPVFEGGTVIKFGSSCYEYFIINGGDTLCQFNGSAYRPVVFTSMDDDSVGDQIDGSSGNPLPDQSDFAYILEGGGGGGATNATVAHARFSYAGSAYDDYNDTSYTFADCQFVQCSCCAICVGDSSVYLGNDLFSGCGAALEGNWAGNNFVLDAENITADSINCFCQGNGSGGITNSILTACDSSISNFIIDSTCVVADSGAGIFQTVGDGNYYLTNGSTNRGAGTTNISPWLLADLKTKTTYPPVVYASTTIWEPPTNYGIAAPRDSETGGPDKGYHYDPLDYVFGGVVIGSTTTFASGVAAGWFNDGSGYGIYLQGDWQIANFQGTAGAPGWWVRANTVQESGGNTVWPGAGAAGGLAGAGCSSTYGYSPAQVNLLFTHCSILAGGDGGPLSHFAEYTNGSLVLNATNSEFYSGYLFGYGLSANFMNCLMDRVNAGQSDWFDGCVWTMTNCTWYGGSLTLTNEEYVVRDSVFDGTVISVPAPGDPNSTNCDYNAFGDGAVPFPSVGASNIILNSWSTNLTAFNLQSGPLGSFYLPSDSPLIAAGDMTADQLGLSSFTTQTNQTPEGSAVVDIGYHYMACPQSACISEAGGQLSVSNHSLAIGVPVFVSATWTDVPGVAGEGGFDANGNWVMTHVPTYSTILTNWNTLDWDGVTATNGGPGYFFTPTNTQIGWNSFYYTYSNSPPCGGSGTISTTSGFYVVAVESLAPANTGTWVEISNNTPGTRTFLVQASPTNGQHTLTVYANPIPYLGISSLPDCWSLNGARALSTNLDISVPGVYQVTCVCGTSALTDFFIVTTNAVTTNGATNSALDAPCGTGPSQLGYWSFNNASSNVFASSRGWPPLVCYDVQNPQTPWTNGAEVDCATNAAELAYNYLEPDGSANLNGLHGAIRFWFSPDWNGGAGPGAPGYLFEFGDVYSPGGGWALETDPSGTGLSFVSGSNGMLTTYLTAPIGGWAQGQWHQVVFCYSSNETALFLDGAPAASGPGLAFEPDLATRLADGFTVGSDHNGCGQARGVFDELATFNCPLSQSDVTAGYPYPAIISQPQGRTVAAGDTVFFSVAAAGAGGLSYQWQLNGVNLTASARVSGVTGSTLGVADVSDGDAGPYTVIVVNETASVTSAVAALALNDAAQLGVWNFTAANWAGQQGQLPLAAANLGRMAAWSGNRLWMDTNAAALLVYPDMETPQLETNVSTNFYPASLDFHTGSAVWWFNSDWNSAGFGGNGPGSEARLMDAAFTNASSTYEWWVAMSADGTALTFDTAVNGTVTAQASGAIGWASNTWHQIVLVYGTNWDGSGYSSLYVDTVNIASGGGMPAWPAFAMTSSGFAVGSAFSGGSQMRGVLADLETYNYDVSANGSTFISNNYYAVCGGGPISAGFASKYSSNEFAVATIQGGPAVAMMILVNTNNTNAGTWVPFNSYPVVDLGTSDGQKTVAFCFQSLDGTISQVTKRIWLDRTPAVLTITSPGSNTLDQPVLQLKGFSDKDLCSICYDLSNAAGLMTNLDVLVIGRAFDTSQWRIRTNTFQAFDIGLTPGNNTITLHAMDWAGNWTSASFVYDLDYSSKTNKPRLQLYWPTNGALISGNSFVWRGWVDDPTVSISAQIVDTNGNTNEVNGIVERNGNFWVENLPLAPGSNWLTLTVADAYTNATNFSIGVFQSSVNLTIGPIGDITDQTSVWIQGTISAPDYSVWVNGVEATNLYGVYDTNEFPNDYMYWCAVVPVNSGGTALFEALAIPNGDHGGNGTPGTGGHGTNSTLQNPGNPTPSELCPVLQVEQDKLPCILYSEIHVDCRETYDLADLPDTTPTGTVYNGWQADWTLGSGGSYLLSFLGWDGTFRWIGSNIDAYGNCITYGGTSQALGDYSGSAPTGTNQIGDPSNASKFLWDGFYDYGLQNGLQSLGSCNGAVLGWMGDCETSGTQLEPGIYFTELYHQATTNRCVALQAYIPNGKGVPVQNIVAFNVQASGAQPAPMQDMGVYQGVDIWLVTGSWTPTPPTGMTVAGVVPGADGIAYKVVPSGVPMVILGPDFETGPAAMSGTGFQAMATQAPSSQANDNNPYNVFSIGATKHSVDITANGTNLAANIPNFCVGQFVEFSFTIEPPLPVQPARAIGYWGFTGTYVNEWRSILADSHTYFPQCSDMYYINPQLLCNDTVTNVWISGGDGTNADIPARYGAGCLLFLLFTTEPQPLKIILPTGWFNMYRPVARIFPITDGVQIVREPNDCGEITAGTNIHGVGITFSNIIHYPTNFPGRTEWWQVMTSQGQERVIQTNRIGTTPAGFNTVEDGPGPPFLDDNNPNEVSYSYPYGYFDDYDYGFPVDRPFEALTKWETFVKVNGESFQMTEMFIPPGDGIHVPLRTVQWAWEASAKNPEHLAWSGLGTNGEAGKIMITTPDSDTLAFPRWMSWASKYHWTNWIGQP